jgi:electron transport complex protein RnfD
MMIVVKMCFGGIGQNFVNPALAARAFLMASWPGVMTAFHAVGTKFSLLGVPLSVDAETYATPLAILKGLEDGGGTLPSYLDLFTGNVGGVIGETSALALLLGAAYLLIRRIITWQSPVAFIATVALLTFAGGGDVPTGVLSGGLVLGAFFMATDYTTSPMTAKGQFLFGVGCGILTYIIRRFGGYPEGVSYSILLMNVVTPLIDRFTHRKRFGT